MKEVEKPSSNIISKQIGFILAANNSGETVLEGRGVEGLKNILWVLVGKYKDKFDKVKFKPIELENLYTENDRSNLKHYGKLHPKRISALRKDTRKINDYKAHKCRVSELRLLMQIMEDEGYNIKEILLGVD